MFLMTIFLASLAITPAALTAVTADMTPLDFAIPSQVGEATAKVAIYDEDNTTAPVEAGAAAALSGLTNNEDST
jgi:hypothetical protein